MIGNRNGKIGIIIAALFFAACASRPPKVQEIPATADASAELELTQTMLNAAKETNLDILAPESYERAQTSFNEAREGLVKGKDKQKVLKNISDSRGWLEQAQAKGGITRTATKGLSDARSGAIRAKAPTLFPSEFADAEEQTRELAEEAESGDLDKANKAGESVARLYHKLEVDSVAKNFLSEAQLNLEAAKKEKADKTSPKTLRATEEKLAAALSLINANPRNTEAISKAASEATEQSKFLLTVNQKTKAGNTEDLVLQSESQKRKISGLSTEQAQSETALSTKEQELSAKDQELRAKEEELRKQSAALKTAEELRNQLKPNEAEVFVENNAVKVRLKGVQFGSNKATLNKKSTALLEKVDGILGTVGASSILIEGHTDSIGSEEDNKTISEMRAQTVQNYMVQKGQISSSAVQAVGKGEEDPISDNSTAKGRAENRRIDLIIEPKIE